MPGLLNFYVRRTIEHSKIRKEDDQKDKLLPPITAKPRINCRFRIRKDLEGYIGFFKGRGVLTLDDTAARVIQLIDGERSIEDIVSAMEKRQPSENGQTREHVFSFLQSINRGEFLAFSE